MFSTNASSSADYVPLITTVNQSEDRRWKESSRPEAAQTSATQWILTALISIVAISSALFSFNLSSAPSLPLDPAGLEKLKPYPNLEKTSELFSEKNAPKTWFPNTIVHTSSVEPDKLSTPSSHVLLSSTESTFFRWSTSFQEYALCYITAFVSNASTLASSTKSFTSTGNISALEVWNVTSISSSQFKSGFTWSTRPRRLNLIGTTNFSSEHAREGEMGWQLKPPTPRFECGGTRETMIEVACPEEAAGCKLEFEQVFSEPALSFDLQELR
ncbi:uncharacterized protein STEHIDRAFT_159347 [Stereum hirsutum FP-91666 SS1]|uniref:uncharacterized protein n=1 Tax=Stereum hirsutum (strain FP-91666) TaxID=721885 RepID=UPI000444A4D1|nr:uncharacterized protein STEHIDRAFT_159347 [Stereum hirsutum FP-91666 SS1]EIM83720.1 hypothetical protein STEHIDRAFT_159347 [Stereum hirsutum FP-91666 SS1]